MKISEPCYDLLTPAPVAMALANQELFSSEFLDYLPENLHIYDGFEREAMKVISKGFGHYSSRTIVEVLRHHSALTEVGGKWKINDHTTPYFARLFALLHPTHVDLFEYRTAKSALGHADLPAAFSGGRHGR